MSVQGRSLHVVRIVAHVVSVSNGRGLRKQLGDMLSDHCLPYITGVLRAQTIAQMAGYVYVPDALPMHQGNAQATRDG